MKKTIKIGKEFYCYSFSPRSFSPISLVKTALLAIFRRIALVVYFALLVLLCLFFVNDDRYRLLRTLTAMLHKDIATAHPIEDWEND